MTDPTNPTPEPQSTVPVEPLSAEEEAELRDWVFNQPPVGPVDFLRLLATLDVARASQPITAGALAELRRQIETLPDFETRDNGSWPWVSRKAVLELLAALPVHEDEPEPLTPEEEAARAEVSERWSTRYRHAAVALRLALGSIRSLKLPDWFGQQVEAAWRDSAWLVDITATPPAPVHEDEPTGIDPPLLPGAHVTTANPDPEASHVR